MTNKSKSKWNAWRASTASEALERFTDVTGGSLNDERDDMISDLLCNLGHYCDQHKLDYDALIARAKRGLKHERACGDEEYGNEEPPEETSGHDSDYLSRDALENIAEYPVNGNSDPDVMAAAIEAMQSMARIALEQ